MFGLCIPSCLCNETHLAETYMLRTNVYRCNCTASHSQYSRSHPARVRAAPSCTIRAVCGKLATNPLILLASPNMCEMTGRVSKAHTPQFIHLDAAAYTPSLVCTQCWHQLAVADLPHIAATWPRWHCLYTPKPPCTEKTFLLPLDHSHARARSCRARSPSQTLVSVYDVHWQSAAVLDTVFNT